METDNKEPKYTSDNDDNDDTSVIKQTPNARRLICQARENPKYTQGNSTNRLWRGKIYPSLKKIFF